MKIIEEGKCPIYRAECSTCKSVLEAKRRELNSSANLISNGVMIGTCPVCSSTVGGWEIIGVAEIEAEEIPRRWRADKGRAYYTLTSQLSVAVLTDNRDCYDNGLYEIGNYFQTREEAEEVVIKVREVFKQ